MQIGEVKLAGECDAKAKCRVTGNSHRCHRTVSSVTKSRVGVGQFAPVSETARDSEWLMIAQKLLFLGKPFGEFRMNKTLKLQAPILTGFWARRFAGPGNVEYLKSGFRKQGF